MQRNGIWNVLCKWHHQEIKTGLGYVRKSPGKHDTARIGRCSFQENGVHLERNTHEMPTGGPLETAAEAAEPGKELQTFGG